MLLGENEVLKNVQIRVGSVFRMEFFPKDRVTPKGPGATSRMKYFVIVGTDRRGEYVGATLINTDININLAQQIALFQHCIYPSKYGFLNGKYRYVDCYTIREIEERRIVETAQYIGYLDDEDVARVRSLLRTSPVIDQSAIERFGL